MPTMVVLPQFVVSHWWEKWLHNQTSNTIREALLEDQIENGRGRPVIDVPYHIGGSMFQPVMAKQKNRTATVGNPVITN
jgi:hypothetical protein